MSDHWVETAGGAQLHFFDDSRTFLMREVNKHPPLIALLQEANLDGEQDWPDQLATIAAYVLVILDGNYTPHELDRLASNLYHKLQLKRN